jgi:hypothetical protein
MSPSTRRLLGSLGNIVWIGESGIAAAGERQDLQLAEAGERQIEAEAAEITEFQSEQILVPAGVQRELVVGNDVCPLLRLAQTGKLDDRYGCHPELPCRQQPPVAGYDAVLAVDQDRVGEAELADRRGNLRDLRVRVRPGILSERDQSRGRAVINCERAKISLNVASRTRRRREILRWDRNLAVDIEALHFPARANQCGKYSTQQSCCYPCSYSCFYARLRSASRGARDRSVLL